MKLYAYCVVTASALEQLQITGLSDQKVYSLASSNLAAAVSQLEGDAAPITKENVLIHQRVVTTVLEQTTPLPFRFGTVISEEQLTSYLESRKEALAKNLELVHGCVEMSIKIIWQNSAISQPTLKSRQEGEAAEGVGASFLRSKSEQIRGSQQLLAQAEGISAWLKSFVLPHVRDARFEMNPSQRLVLAAACLVERSRLDLYRSALERARQERPDLHFLTSGPWPPYTFANIDLEFKTYFGVS